MYALQNTIMSDNSRLFAKIENKYLSKDPEKGGLESYAQKALCFAVIVMWMENLLILK